MDRAARPAAAPTEAAPAGAGIPGIAREVVRGLGLRGPSKPPMAKDARRRQLDRAGRDFFLNMAARIMTRISVMPKEKTTCAAEAAKKRPRIRLTTAASVVSMC